jgi:hypothetical protein
MSTLTEFKFLTERLGDDCVVTVHRINDSVKTYNNQSELNFDVYTSPGRIQKFIITVVSGQISVNKLVCSIQDKLQQPPVISIKIKQGGESRFIHQPRIDISFMSDRDRFIFEPFVLSTGESAEIKVATIPIQL